MPCGQGQSTTVVAASQPNRTRDLIARVDHISKDPAKHADSVPGFGCHQRNVRRLGAGEENVAVPFSALKLT